MGCACSFLGCACVGEMCIRDRTIPIGAKAPQAAGVIHSDFERGFIKAETASYADYVELGLSLIHI